MNKEDFIKKLPLITDRLIIKRTTLEDVELLLKMDKQEVTQKYLGGIKHKTYEERIKFLKKKLLKEDVISMTVYVTNKSVGFIDIKILKNNICELSYIFDNDYTNNGYCTEACKVIIETLFNSFNIDKIIADTLEDNLSSRKVLEKLNFTISHTETKNNIKFIVYTKEKRC